MQRPWLCHVSKSKIYAENTLEVCDSVMYQLTNINLVHLLDIRSNLPITAISRNCKA